MRQKFLEKLEEELIMMENKKTGQDSPEIKRNKEQFLHVLNIQSLFETRGEIRTHSCCCSRMGNIRNIRNSVTSKTMELHMTSIMDFRYYGVYNDK